jgi:hypothetical protein
VDFILTVIRQKLSKDLDARRTQKHVCSNEPPKPQSMPKKLKDALGKLSPIKSSARTPAAAATVEPKTASLSSVTEVEETHVNSRNTIKSDNQDTSSSNENSSSNLWSYKTPKKAIETERDTVSASNGPVKMTFVAQKNQQIVFKVRLVRSPWRSTSKKHVKRSLHLE